MRTNLMSIVLILIVLSLWNCGPGRVKYGEKGTVIGGSAKVKCDKPSKRYTKSLIANLDASLDSLKQISKASLEAELETKIVRLSDYSTEGLDRDLMLYRLCQIFNNRGFTPTQAEQMTLKMLDLWDDEVKKKTSQN